MNTEQQWHQLFKQKPYTASFLYCCATAPKASILAYFTFKFWSEPSVTRAGKTCVEATLASIHGTWWKNKNDQSKSQTRLKFKQFHKNQRSYNDFIKIGSCRLHVYFRAHNHFPEDVKNHIVMFIKSAAEKYSQPSSKEFRHRTVMPLLKWHKPKKANRKENLALHCLTLLSWSLNQEISQVLCQ